MDKEALREAYRFFGKETIWSRIGSFFNRQNTDDEELQAAYDFFNQHNQFANVSKYLYKAIYPTIKSALVVLLIALIINFNVSFTTFAELGSIWFGGNNNTTNVGQDISEQVHNKLKSFIPLTGSILKGSNYSSPLQKEIVYKIKEALQSESVPNPNHLKHWLGHGLSDYPELAGLLLAYQGKGNSFTNPVVGNSFGGGEFGSASGGSDGQVEGENHINPSPYYDLLTKKGEVQKSGSLIGFILRNVKNFGWKHALGVKESDPDITTILQITGDGPVEITTERLGDFLSNYFEEDGNIVFVKQDKFISIPNNTIGLAMIVELAEGEGGVLESWLDGPGTVAGTFRFSYGINGEPYIDLNYDADEYSYDIQDDTLYAWATIPELADLNTDDIYDLKLEILNYQSIDGGIAGDWAAAGIDDLVMSVHGQPAAASMPELPPGAFGVIVAALFVGLFLLRRKRIKISSKK